MTHSTPAVCPSLYSAHGLEVHLGGKRVLGPLDLTIQSGSFLGILGPNGSGKTTLIRVLTGAVAPKAGTVLLAGKPLLNYRPQELARRVGVVPQQFTLDFNFTVAEMVAMGRYAHGDERPDNEAVVAALEATGLTALANRFVTELSGGERQRALIAQTLAQTTRALLLDEPLNNLDLNHQLEVMQLLHRLHSEGRTVAVILHDLNIAAQYCDELLLLDHGQVVARGEPQTILEPALIMEVFHVRVAVHRHGSRPYVTPLWTKAQQDISPPDHPAVHVIAGGGAASELVEELIMHGYAPTLGIVSVFDTDYATAQRYELAVVSAPPFQAFPEETLAEHQALVDKAETLIVAPVFFGPGNLALLRTVLDAARSGKRVLILNNPPISERDLSDGQATQLQNQLVQAGACLFSDPAALLRALHAGTSSDVPLQSRSEPQASLS